MIVVVDVVVVVVVVDDDDDVVVDDLTFVHCPNPARGHEVSTVVYRSAGKQTKQNTVGPVGE